MKKLMVICLMVVMLASMSLMVFAAGGGFVSSPSNNLVPEIVGAEVEDKTCPAVLVITPYAERSDLSEEDEATIEKAYADIKNAEDIGTINEKVAKIATDWKMSSKDFVVSDLFNLDHSNCSPEEHAKHGAFTVKLSAETLDNFVALLHYTNGAWELVENAKVEDGVLNFEVDDFSPFAVVVNTNPDAANKSSATPWIIGGVATAAVVGGGAVAATVIIKKKKIG